jgi:hypothetical protein
MVLFWVLIGIGVAWMAFGVYIITKVNIGAKFFIAMLVIITVLIAIAAGAIGTWYRLHPDPAWGRCVKTELKQAPTQVDGSIVNKPEWVCTLWG